MSKRDDILQTTLNIASESGLYATSIPLIIKESNVATGTIYHHFKNKEDLIDTLYRELKKEMGKAFIQDINSKSNYKETFFLIWKNLYNFYIENPKKFQFIEEYSNSPRVQKEIKAITNTYYQAIIDFIESGVKMGILRNLSVNIILNLLFGNVSAIVRMVLWDEFSPSDDLLNNIIQTSWDSVKIN